MKFAKSVSRHFSYFGETKFRQKFKELEHKISFSGPHNIGYAMKHREPLVLCLTADPGKD